MPTPVNPVGLRDALADMYKDRMMSDPTAMHHINSYLKQNPIEEKPKPKPVDTPEMRAAENRQEIVDTAKNVSDLGSSLVTAFVTRNPAAFADTAFRKLFYKHMSDVDEDRNAGIFDHLKTAADEETKREAAVEILKLESCPLSVTAEALEALFDDEFIGWEPETIIWELIDLGVPFSDDLMDRINACLCLIMQPAFFNDITVFENICLIANDVPPLVGIVQKPDIGEMCVGYVDAAKVMARFQKDLKDALPHDDIDLYVATALYHDHYLVAPEPLDFAQEILNKYTGMGDTAAKIKEEWEKFDRDNPRELGETMEDVQLGKLWGCYLAVEEYLERVKTFKSKL